MYYIHCMHDVLDPTPPRRGGDCFVTAPFAKALEHKKPTTYVTSSGKPRLIEEHSLLFTCQCVCIHSFEIMQKARKVLSADAHM